MFSASILCSSRTASNYNSEDRIPVYSCIWKHRIENQLAVHSYLKATGFYSAFQEKRPCLSNAAHKLHHKVSHAILHTYFTDNVPRKEILKYWPVKLWGGKKTNIGATCKIYQENPSATLYPLCVKVSCLNLTLLWINPVFSSEATELSKI